MNAILRYPGSKWRIADWIIGHFPEHHSYVEPFFGSGAVLFNKPKSPIETVNDMDGDVVNLFRWIREEPERLAEAIYFTPYARDVYEEAFERRYTETDPFRCAVYFYIRMMMGHGFRTSGEKVGWKHDVQGREAAYAAKGWCDLPSQILQAAERLKMVQIENRPALEVIKKFNYPNVLIYADPPYLMETRGDNRQYKHEMTDRDHVELLEALNEHKGPAIISGYASDLYNHMLSDWARETIISTTQAGVSRTEYIWMNFEVNQNLFDIMKEDSHGDL